MSLEAVEAARRGFDDQLDTYGAPPGETIEERLRAWEQRERECRQIVTQLAGAREKQNGWELTIERLMLWAENLTKP